MLITAQDSYVPTRILCRRVTASQHNSTLIISSASLAFGCIFVIISQTAGFS